MAFKNNNNNSNNNSLSPIKVILQTQQEKCISLHIFYISLRPLNHHKKKKKDGLGWVELCELKIFKPCNPTYISWVRDFLIQPNPLTHSNSYVVGWVKTCGFMGLNLIETPIVV